MGLNLALDSRVRSRGDTCAHVELPRGGRSRVEHGALPPKRIHRSSRRPADGQSAPHGARARTVGTSQGLCPGYLSRALDWPVSPAALRAAGPTEYRFCADAGCPIVYFSGTGSQFGTADLRVPVWQKLPSGCRLVCYCFGESEASIRAEIELTGRSLAVQRIREHIAAGRCACDVRNPRGTCCLGDVMAAVRRLLARRA